MANIRGRITKPLLLHIAERTFLPGRHLTLLQREPLPYVYPFADLNVDAEEVWTEMRELQEKLLQTQRPSKRKELAYKFSLTLKRLYELIDMGDMSVHDRMYAAIGPTGKEVLALRNAGYVTSWDAWKVWDYQHGSAWRIANECATPSDTELLRRGLLVEESGDPDAIPSPPGLEELRALDNSVTG